MEQLHKLMHAWMCMVGQSCLTLCDPTDCSPPWDFPIKKAFSQFSCSVVSNSLWPHWLQHARPPCPLPTPGVHPNPCPLCWWCHPTISSSVVPFSSPNLSQHQGFFKWACSLHQMARVLEFQLQHQSLHTQDWSPLGWTGWISLQSKGFSRVFSNTPV